MTGKMAGLGGFDHMVVLMLENRSFDNLLGFLYGDDEPRHSIWRPTER